MARSIFSKNEVTAWPVPNVWDIVGLVLVMALLFLLGFAASAMLGQFHPGDTLLISLDPRHLPYYTLRTVLRMLISIVISVGLAFVFGTWAAKSRYAERLIIPSVDILQSVPILGFLSLGVVTFVVLFKGSMLGPECAAIFALVTAQAWNIVLSIYQSVKTVPQELHEASRVLHLSAWQKFWRVEVPFAMPSLVWNIMLSMSSSWIFLVASEAISIANHTLYLPGIGSYIALAIETKNTAAIIYVIFTMVVVIWLMDQLLFRPLVTFSEKFKMHETSDEEEADSWLVQVFQRTLFLRHVMQRLTSFGNSVVNFRWFRQRICYTTPRRRYQRWQSVFAWSWHVSVFASLALALGLISQSILREVPFSEILTTIYEGAVTGLRVLVAILISSVIWVPVGVMIGLSPRATRIIQPIAQFLAAFPMNLIFPVMVILILHFHLNANIWVTPLMILGSQWYILFNVIAGAAVLPRPLRNAVSTLNVRGWLWWRRLMLPAVYPYYITGAITAAGAAWNVSILAEVLTWGSTQIRATGLGAYIVQVAAAGDFRRLTLGIVVMSLYVVLLNRCLWRPLFVLAEGRYRL